MEYRRSFCGTLVYTIKADSFQSPLFFALGEGCRGRLGRSQKQLGLSALFVRPSRNAMRSSQNTSGATGYEWRVCAWRKLQTSSAGPSTLSKWQRGPWGRGWLQIFRHASLFVWFLSKSWRHSRASFCSSKFLSCLNILDYSTAE